LLFLEKDEAKAFTDFINQKSYLFKKDELEKIRIDLTFSPESNTVTNKQLDYVKTSLIKFPEIKPLTFILKRIFHINNLNQTFNGGLSSFSLFLMILAYVKVHRTNNPMFNLTKLLSDLLICYGNYFDFYTTLIDVNLDK
jgi:DNA polymerase sigma